jgi:hypothetical protein
MSELIKGPQLVKDLIERGERLGIKRASLRWAKEKLGIKSKKVGKGWILELPVHPTILGGSSNAAS